MSNPIIEVPEEVKVSAQRVVAGRACYLDTTVAMAEFVLGLNKPEIEVEPFVIYKVKVRGHGGYRMGFRVARNAPFPWVSFNSHAPDKEEAYATSSNNLIHGVDEVKVIERWSPEAPETKFGIGDKYDVVEQGREVLVKGVLCTDSVDSEGDIRVEMNFSTGLSDSHYVSAADTAYVEENNGN